MNECILSTHISCFPYLQGFGTTGSFLWIINSSPTSACDLCIHHLIVGAPTNIEIQPDFRKLAISITVNLDTIPESLSQGIKHGF